MAFVGTQLNFCVGFCREKVLECGSKYRGETSMSTTRMETSFSNLGCCAAHDNSSPDAYTSRVRALTRTRHGTSRVYNTSGT